MSNMRARRKAKTNQPSVPNVKHDLFVQAMRLAKVVRSKSTMGTNRIMATKKDIDIPKLEKAIARYRRAIALQSRILDELEAVVKSIKQDAREKKPAKSNKPTTRRKT